MDIRRSSRLAQAVALVAAIALAGCTGDAPPSGAAAGGDCVTGGTVTEINGKPARVFCGPATAVVSIGGAELAFKDGACEFLGDTLTVNLGTTIPGELTGEPDYFGLTAFGIDALPLTEMPAITWIKDGESGHLGGAIPELTISDDRSTIEFSGTVPGEGAASGVIRC